MTNDYLQNTTTQKTWRSSNTNLT